MDPMHSDTPVVSFSLHELNAKTGAGRPGLRDDCVVASSQSHLEPFRFPCRIDAFVIGVCTEGEATGLLNLQEFRLRKDTMFLFGPKSILQARSTGPFKAHVIAISSEFLRRICIDLKHILPLMLQFSAHPSLELPHEKCLSLRGFISLIEHELEEPETDFTDEIIGGLITTTIYKVGDILGQYLVEHPEVDGPPNSRAEEYFRQFTALLGKHYLRERSVSFYARQLCITPKYLTTLIKRVSGKSVSEWIDHFVILEAKTLLKYSDKSIQEIAYCLNFPNQSFFGSYFKRNTGLSPSQYKTRGGEE